MSGRAQGRSPGRPAATTDSSRTCASRPARRCPRCTSSTTRRRTRSRPAASPKQASITVTTGLFELMTDRELEGVLGHELGHIRNYDIRVSLIVFGLVVAVGILADLFMRFAFFGGGRRGGNGQAQLLFLIFGVVAALIAPLLAGAVQAAISRQREYLADATSAMTTRDPDGLASALAKLGEFGAPLKRANTSMAHLWIADPLTPNALSRACSRPTRRSPSGSSGSRRWEASSDAPPHPSRTRVASPSTRSC